MTGGRSAGASAVVGGAFTPIPPRRKLRAAELRGAAWTGGAARTRPLGFPAAPGGGGPFSTSRFEARTAPRCLPWSGSSLRCPHRRLDAVEAEAL